MIKQPKANISPAKCEPKKKIKFKFKSLIILLLIAVCVLFIASPKVYILSSLDAISTWTFKVLPVLLPFFIISKIIVALVEPKQSKMDKLFNRIYNAPATSSTVFFLSALSGYPMGAKLICDQYDRGIYTHNDAKQMLAFCSISGPMFMLGTVGVAIFNSYLAGLIILIANLLAALINGLIYRGKSPIKTHGTQNNATQTITMQSAPEKGSVLVNSVSDSLQAILIVCCYMVVAFLLIDVLNNTGILPFIANNLERLFKLKNGVVNAFLNGIFEITRGANDLAATGCSLKTITVLESGLIGFGGISVFMQSLTFLNKLNIRPRYILLQKLTQGLLALIIALPLSVWLL